MNNMQVITNYIFPQTTNTWQTQLFNDVIGINKNEDKHLIDTMEIVGQ